MLVLRPLRLRVAPVLLAGAIVVTACSGGGSSKAKTAASTAPPSGSNAIRLRLGVVKVASAGNPGVKLPDPTRDKMIATVNTYVTDGIVKPLTGGKKASGLGDVFDSVALARVSSADGTTLLDEGMPKTGRLAAKTATVSLTALADPSGAIVLASAGLLLDLNATVDGEPIEIKRNGELLLAPAGNSWKISGYDMGVQRDGPGIPPDATSSTAVSKP